ncbi:FAA1 protein [Actinobacillus equuli]|nr:FAA1 protein [Actinobacillus equuli]
MNQLLDFHFVHRVRQQAKKLQNSTALRHKEHGTWVDISWQDFQSQIDNVSLALLAHGIGIQDKLAFCSQHAAMDYSGSRCVTDSCRNGTNLRDKYCQTS